MFWLIKLALYSQICFFFCFVSLETLLKVDFSLETIVTNQGKATSLAMPPSVCVESEIWMYIL